ncbi:MAG: class II fructose-bisphosphate aldolase [Bacillota bacterium]
MLTSPAELLSAARDGKYAVGAFNFHNLDIVHAILSAAEEEKAPVILQVTPTYLSHLGVASGATAALAAIQECPVPAALHLDHANTFEEIIRALCHGFNSVMIDASRFPLEKNIDLTARVVETAHAVKAYTEAELGHILGVEDLDQPDRRSGGLAAPGEAAILVSRTGVDSLAPAVGTAHGMYTSTPNIDFSRIREIADKTRVPLVLHGGSGIPDEMIREAIAAGIQKINVGTELKLAWAGAVKRVLESGETETRKIASAAREGVKEVVRQKIRLFGANGRV